MQLFPKKLHLALSTVLFIACHGSAIEPVSGKSIVDQCDNMNDRTLEPVLQKLAKGNIVHSIKGANGGYFIADPDNLTVRDVMETMLDAPDTSKYSFSGLEDITHDVFTDVFNTMLEHNSYTTITQLKLNAQEKGYAPSEYPVLTFSI
tara:strand:+ start:682 stop:1125 length:444 start_codon:yes stop_codon:yes gene_type:complete